MGIILGTALVSFGIQNIHNQINITEGGVLGMLLLLSHWFNISPAIVSPILDMLCYIMAFRYIDKDFIKLSIIASLSLAGFLKFWETLSLELPNFLLQPITAAILGGLFVGIGAGIVIRQGGSCGGDDALAISISKALNWRISHAYLCTDTIVLLLSLSYIPVQGFLISMITVTVSSFSVEFVQNVGRQKKEKKELKNISSISSDVYE